MQKATELIIQQNTEDSMYFVKVLAPLLFTRAVSCNSCESVSANLMSSFSLNKIFLAVKPGKIHPHLQQGSR